MKTLDEFKQTFQRDNTEQLELTKLIPLSWFMKSVFLPFR